MIQPWLQDHWQRLLELGVRLPHALLLTGPAGLGKRQFAEALAARLLCEQPDQQGFACGQCQPCHWRLAGTHPDYFTLFPAAELARADTGAAQEATAAKQGGEGAAKAASAQILIEQVRTLQEALSLTAHHGGHRVVIIDPAEAMNLNTANALLKLLEEPPAGCVFLLLSATPGLLLPTIRSRCQQWPCPRPSAASLAQWLAAANPGRQALFALSGGLPLAAERMEAAGLAPVLERFVRELSRLQLADCVPLAAEWERWLKSKEALQAGFDLTLLIDWMQCWVSDLALLRLGAGARFFPAQQDLLARIAARATVAAVSGCYNTLLQIRRLSRHPLNVRLVLEDMLLRYAAALGPQR